MSIRKWTAWIAIAAMLAMMIPAFTVSALGEKQAAEAAAEESTGALPEHGEAVEPQELAAGRLSGAMLSGISSGDSVPRCSKFGFRTFYYFDAAGYLYMGLYDTDNNLQARWSNYHSRGTKGWINLTMETSKLPAGKYTLLLWTTYTDDIPFAYTVYFKDSVSLSGESISADSATYTGDPIIPSVTVSYKGWKLLETDYTVSCTDNINAGTGKVTATGKGAYSGQLSTDFTIKKASIYSNNDLSIECDDCLYTGDYVEPDVKITYKGRTLKENVDYTLSFSNNKNIGNGRVSVSGMGNFSGSRTVSFRIFKYDINNTDVTGIDSEYTYTGSAIRPVPVVTCDGVELRKNADYELEYVNNTNAGTATVVIKGLNDYGGTKKVSFAIKPMSLDGAKADAVSRQTYNGSAIEPSITVRLNGEAVPADGLKIAYKNNTNVGTATVTISGKGNYTGKLETTFEIVACDIGNADIAQIPAQTYTGKALTPKPAYVKVAGRSLAEGKDYTLAYENNVEGGTAKVTVTGIGNYTGKRTLTFTISELVKEIKLSPDKLVLKKGKSGTIKAEVLPASAADKSLTWKSSNTNIATVDANGVVQTLKTGTVTITATANDGSGVSATTTVVVMKTLPKSVSIDKKKATLEVGDTIKLKATVKPAKADDRSVTWTSSNPDVAKVSKKGKVTAVSVGTAKIIATSANGKTAVCKITVKPTKVSKITIKGKNTMKVGETQTLKAKIAPGKATDKSLSWKSSNTAIATVDENGVVTAIKKGSVSITVKALDGSKVKAVFKIKIKK